MTQEEFLQRLTQEGLPTPVLVSQPANGGLDIHTHDFVVRALVVEGLITISTNNVETNYGAGDVFELAFKQPHSERYGPAGVKYLASRQES